MNKILSFVRLDFITVKAYLTLKNLAIFVGIALMMIFAKNSVFGAVSMLMACAAMCSSYPFAIGEKSNVDVLYTTLSIKRKTVVLGRYIFALTLDLFTGLFTSAFSFLMLAIMQKDFDAFGSLGTVLILFILFSVIQAVLLPIYFKLGYTKAKVLAFLPFFVLSLAMLAFSNIFSDVFSFDQIGSVFFEWLSVNSLLTALVGAGIWLAIMAVSYKISLSFYRKRDF